MCIMCVGGVICIMCVGQHWVAFLTHQKLTNNLDTNSLLQIVHTQTVHFILIISILYTQSPSTSTVQLVQYVHLADSYPERLTVTFPRGK